MPLSILLYESDSIFIEEDMNKLKNYFDNSSSPSQISKFVETIVEGSAIYHIFRIAKKVNKSFQEYTINVQGNIEPVERERLDWETFYVYIRENSKFVYVRGALAGWVNTMLSSILYTSSDKIKLREIDTARLEQDIRQNARFQSTGTCYVDSDGTKITIKNTAGVDLTQHFTTRDKADITKNHIDILIEKDDYNLDVYVYPDGKITIHGFTRNPLTALRIFLKIWSDIRDYSIGTSPATPANNL